MTVQGFNKTGIPSALWEFMEPYSKIDQVSGIAVLAIVILILSNLVSNVPTGMSMFPFCLRVALKIYSSFKPISLEELLGCKCDF